MKLIKIFFYFFFGDYKKIEKKNTIINIAHYFKSIF